MKITLNWLRQYVDFDGSPGELSERLTMLGLEVEGVQKIGGEFEGIVVAQVVTRDKHPNADKLSLCRVNDGRGERQIVCGANNFKAGDKVPLILPGASLPPKPGSKEPFAIKVGKIRGVESHGMLCSPLELGLAGDADGLLILRDDAIVGQPFAEYLGRTGSDVVYDLEVTPNRPDLNSVIGIAREVAALTGGPLRIPEVAAVSGPLSAAGSTSDELIDSRVAVQIDEPTFCPRYTARIVQGVTVGPSPDWLRETLEKVGVRSINNVVDVTNYVMLETGQPLHAFDYHLLSHAPGNKPTIVIRRAAAGEKFTTLDGKERALTNEVLLIADERQAIALAGIMGGQNTEINGATRDVLIESAYFNARNIRRTSKRLDLRSESSYRFERGVDPGITEWVSRRCAQLILETAGGRLVPGVVDACPQPMSGKEITLRHSRTNVLLGHEISVAQQIENLQRLGLEMVDQGGASTGGALEANATSFRVPTWRPDLKREVDLIEEVARLYGVDRLPSTPPRGGIGSNPFDTRHDQISEVRRILTGLGLDETQGQTIISQVAARSATTENVLLLNNPLNSEMNALRPGLLPGLLDSVRHNVSRKNSDIGLFEVGRVFVPGGKEIKEERRVAIALTGKRFTPFWTGIGSQLSPAELKTLKGMMDVGTYDERSVESDWFDLKGIVEEFLEQFGVRGTSFSGGSEKSGLFVEYATVSLGGKIQLGQIGRLLPTLARRLDVPGDIFLAELNLDHLLARRAPGKSFKPMPQFPAIRRDVAMLLSEAVTHETVESEIRKARPENLEEVRLFDVFRGNSLPTGQKSAAYAFIYRSPERTLTDTEVNVTHEALVRQLKERLNAAIR